MNGYLEMKRRHQEEFNNFPMFFAFSEKQFDEGMRKFGLTTTDTDKICRLPVSGGFMLKADRELFTDLCGRHEKELNNAINADVSGNGFIYGMFNYELANHEYGYTRDVSPTLDALGLTQQDIDNNPSLARGLKKAKIHQLKDD